MAMIGVRSRSPTRGADRGGRLETVHFRHLNVHQDGVERLPVERSKRLAAVLDHDDLIAPLLQQADGQPLIDRVVLGQQEPEPPRALDRHGPRRRGRRAVEPEGWAEGGHDRVQQS